MQRRIGFSTLALFMKTPAEWAESITRDGFNAVEILCELLQGKTIQEAESLTEDTFIRALGSTGNEYLKKVRGIIELLHRGITRYKSQSH